MKKITARLICTVLCAIILASALVSCSKKPYEYELSEYITLPRAPEELVVTHEEILAAVEETKLNALKNKATLETVTHRGAMPTDTVKISFSCYKVDDEKVLTDISDSECILVLGEGKYPDELENAIIRRTVGEKFSIIATLPESFTALNLAGKQLRYDVEIKEIKAEVISDYNDDFVKSISDFQSVTEYEEYLYERMKEEIIFDKLLEHSTVKHYPVDEVQEYTSSFIKYYTEKANALKLTLEQYVAKKFFINITDFHLKADEYAKSLVKEEMLLYSLARSYNLELTDYEYTQGAQKYVAEYELESLSKLESKFGTDYVRQTVLMDKVLTFLSSKITVTGAPEAAPV